MGAALQQWVDISWQPMSFFSRKFLPSQQKYTPYDRELHAIYSAVKYFRHMLEARHIIFTDHKPITFAFTKRTDKFSPRQFRYLDFIAQFTTDIRHTSEQGNIVANALSRITVEPAQEQRFPAEPATFGLHSAAVQAPLDYAALTKAQEEDADVSCKLYC
jgi:hypothetical protein